jgi:membrane protease subunit HflK
MPQQNDNDGQAGSRRSGANPGSDIEDFVRQAKGRFTQGPHRRGVLVYAVLALAVIGAWTSYYTVPSDLVAILQRFGKYTKEVPPGLHFKLPLGIDRATIVPVKRQLKQEFGFTTPGASDSYQSPRGGPQNTRRETEMVTGDLNAALVEWVVQYRISDPVKFLFEVRQPSATPLCAYID